MKQLANQFQLDRQLFKLYELGLSIDELTYLQKHKEEEKNWE